MADAALAALLRGTGGVSVRLAGDAFMRASARAGLRAWGRCRRRDDDGVTRFHIAAGPEHGIVLPEKTDMEADLDASRLSLDGRVYSLPPDRLGSDEESRRLALAGAGASLCGLPEAAKGGGPFAQGFDYARANLPARSFPSTAKREEVLYLHNGRTAAAAGALAAGCRIACAAAAYPELEALAAPRGLELERAPDGEAAVYQAAAGGFCDVPALAVLDDRSHRAAEEALLWAARAGLPLVALVLDAGESAFVKAANVYGRSAPGLARAPASIAEIFQAMIAAFAAARAYRTCVTVLADRLLTERWETLRRPVAAKACEGAQETSAPGLRRAAAAESAALEEKALLLESREPAPKAAGGGEPGFIAWGGADASVRWALKALGREETAGVLTVRSLAPLLSSDAYAALRAPARLIAVESTPGQPLRRWVRAAAGREAETLRLWRPYRRERLLSEIAEALR